MGHYLPIQRLLRLEGGQSFSIQEYFERFHELNPWVCQELVRMAREYKTMGWKHVGVGHLVEVLRWEYARQTRGDVFKINNNYRSRYVRFISDNYPDIADMFNTRELRSA